MIVINGLDGAPNEQYRVPDYDRNQSEQQVLPFVLPKLTHMVAIV
jgi:hypothetical protein